MPKTKLFTVSCFYPFYRKASFFFLPARKIFLKTWTFQVHFQPDSRIQHELFRSKKIRRRRRRKNLWPFFQWEKKLTCQKWTFQVQNRHPDMNFSGPKSTFDMNFSGPPKRGFFPSWQKKTTPKSKNAFLGSLEAFSDPFLVEFWSESQFWPLFFLTPYLRFIQPKIGPP